MRSCKKKSIATNLTRKFAAARDLTQTPRLQMSLLKLMRSSILVAQQMFLSEVLDTEKWKTRIVS